MARLFGISHRGGRGQDFDRSVSVPITRLGTKGGAATLQARARHREVTDEGDCGDGSDCGNGRDEAGGAARAAGAVARQPLGREPSNPLWGGKGDVPTGGTASPVGIRFVPVKG